MVARAPSAPSASDGGKVPAVAGNQVLAPPAVPVPAVAAVIPAVVANPSAPRDAPGMIREVMASSLPEETKVQLIASLVGPTTANTPKKEESDDDCARAQKAIAQRIGTCEKIQVSSDVVNVINGGHMPEGDLKKFVGNMLTANDPVGTRVVALLRHLKADQEYIPGGEANEMFLSLGREIVWRQLLRLAAAMEADQVRNAVSFKGKFSFEDLQQTIEVQCDPTCQGALKTMLGVNRIGKQAQSLTSTQGAQGGRPETPTKAASPAKRPREEKACFRCGLGDHLSAQCTNPALPPAAQKALKQMAFKDFQNRHK